MDFNDLRLRRLDLTREEELQLSRTFPLLMRKVYTWMTLALVITGFTAFVTSESPAMQQLLFGNKLTICVLFALEVCMVLGISARIDRLSITTATLLFVAYSVVNGLTLSVIFLAYTAQSIASVFFISAATFAVMAFLGYTTRRDLTSLGRLLFIALIGLIIALVVNLFLGSSLLSLIVSCAGVVIFIGLTAYDSQKIKQMLLEAPDAEENGQKLALLGSLTLYLDFINLFLHLISILGDRK